jgi:hypothetical protein
VSCDGHGRAGVLGADARKDVARTWQDVEAEVCDVIVTVVVLLATLNSDARKTFAESLDHVMVTALGSEPA